MREFVKTVKLHDNWELQLSVRSGPVIMSILQFVTKLNLSNLQLRNIKTVSSRYINDGMVLFEDYNLTPNLNKEFLFGNLHSLRNISS